MGFMGRGAAYVRRRRGEVRPSCGEQMPVRARQDHWVAPRWAGRMSGAGAGRRAEEGARGEGCGRTGSGRLGRGRCWQGGSCTLYRNGSELDGTREICLGLKW